MRFANWAHFQIDIFALGSVTIESAALTEVGLLLWTWMVCCTLQVLTWRPCDILLYPLIMGLVRIPSSPLFWCFLRITSNFHLVIPALPMLGSETIARTD
jgi:hypothetical protein